MELCASRGECECACALVCACVWYVQCDCVGEGRSCRAGNGWTRTAAGRVDKKRKVWSLSGALRAEKKGALTAGCQGDGPRPHRTSFPPRVQPAAQKGHLCPAGPPRRRPPHLGDRPGQGSVHPRRCSPCPRGHHPTSRRRLALERPRPHTAPAGGGGCRPVEVSPPRGCARREGPPGQQCVRGCSRRVSCTRPGTATRAGHCPLGLLESSPAWKGREAIVPTTTGARVHWWLRRRLGRAPRRGSGYS